MGIIQRVILVITALLLLMGAVIILFFRNFNLLELLVFILIIYLPGNLLYQAFEKKPKDSQSTAPALSPSEENVDKEYPNNPQSPNKILFKTKSVWPFDLFRDTLVIYENSISIIYKGFFLMGWSENLLLSDLYTVRLYTGPFFSSLIFEKRMYETSFEITYLWKSDALRAKELIDGLLLKDKGIIKPSKNLSVEKEKEVLSSATEIDTVKKELGK